MFSIFLFNIIELKADHSLITAQFSFEKNPLCCHSGSIYY